LQTAQRSRAKPGTRGDHVRIGKILVVSVALVASVVPAGATTFVGMTEHTLARGADAIVIGTVRGLETIGKPDGSIATLVTIEVERELKGRVGRRITLKQPGGTIGGRVLWVAGSPQFRVGEQQLLFLSGHRDHVRTTALGLGQFSLRPHARTGETMAERHVDALMLGGRALRRVRLARLLETIDRALADAPVRTAAPLVTEPAETTAPGLERTTVDAYTFLAQPPARWFEPDTAQPVVYGVDPAGDTALGTSASFAALDGAMAAWTNVSGASIVLARGGATAPGPLVCDGVSQIVFNDPFDEMDNPNSCSGVLALGGYCSSSAHTGVNGTTFYRITEGNITFNRGFGACSFWNTTNLAEVATHELGHTIGLGHSSESDNPSPELEDATMYYRAHFDGRGAAVRADDIAGVRFVYPGIGGGDPNVDDSDGDGFVDAQDNCASIPNSAQTDSDADGFGDLCDACPLLSDGADGSCQPIYTSSLKLARGKLVWRGAINLPAGISVAEARALLVNAAGVVVDTASGGGLTQAAARPGTVRYVGGGALIKLKPARGGGYQVRVVARGASAGAGNLISGNLSVGGTTFSNALSCVRRGRRLRCLG
jgi:hypothetical protein